MDDGAVFDAHFHIFDPAFVVEANHGYHPAPFTVADYHDRLGRLSGRLRGGAVVAASFQAGRTAWLRAALAALGPGFVGVVDLPAEVTDDDVRSLDAVGVRAVRVNLRRGGPAALAGLDRLANRVFELAGWHVEVYVDGAHLDQLAPRLAALPRVCIDHLGLPVDRSGPGYRALVGLVAGGARVKASGFGRQRVAVPPVLRELAAVDPTALVFGTDLPSTRAPRAFQDADVVLVRRVLDPGLARSVLHDNAVALYAPPRR